MEIGPKDAEKKNCFQKIARKIFWVVGTSRNAFLVLLSGFLGYYFVMQSAELREQLRSDNSTDSTEFTNVSTVQIEEAPFILTGFIPQGMPELQVPPFGFGSNEKYVSFITMISDLGIHLIILPLIALLENIAICKAFCK